MILDKPLPVGGDIASIAHRYEEVVRGLAQSVDDLEGGGLLPLDAIGVEGIDQGNGVLLGQGADDIQRLVEVAVNGDDLRPVDKRLSELSLGDFSLGDDDNGLKPEARPKSGRRGAGVASGGADDRLASLLHRLGHGNHHAPVLEGAGGVASFQLEVKLTAELLLELPRAYQLRIPLAQGDDGGLGGDGEKLTVSFYNALFHFIYAC